MRRYRKENLACYKKVKSIDSMAGEPDLRRNRPKVKQGMRDSLIF